MGWGKIGPSAAEWCGKACNELDVFPNVFAKNGKHLKSVQKSNSLTPHDPRGCAWDPAEELARETPQAYLSRSSPRPCTRASPVPERLKGRSEPPGHRPSSPDAPRARP